MRRALPVLLLSLLAIAYPLGVFFGLQFMEPRLVGLLLAVLFGLRILFSRDRLSKTVRPLLPVMILAMLCSATAFALNSPASLRLTPACINFASMVVFALTLWKGPPMIERFARFEDANLNDRAVAYTRCVTKAWCLFFFVNGCIATYTAVYSSLEVWTLYNGLIAYGLMGAFFAVEYLVRRRVKRAYES